MKRGSVDVPFLLVNGFDILGVVTEITDVQEALTEETGALGDAWQKHGYVGVRKAEISQNGFYDDGVGSVHEMLSTGPGVARVLTYGLEGTATGSRFIGYSGALEVMYARQPSRAAFTKANARYVPGRSAVVEQGRTIRTHKAATATGNATGTPVDHGASSTGSSNGNGAAYLQVSALDLASGTVTNSLLHSSDNITYANLVSFTGLTSGQAPFAQRANVTATSIERYVAEGRQFSTAGFTGGAFVSETYFVGLVRGAGGILAT